MPSPNDTQVTIKPSNDSKLIRVHLPKPHYVPDKMLSAGEQDKDTIPVFEEQDSVEAEKVLCLDV